MRDNKRKERLASLLGIDLSDDKTVENEAASRGAEATLAYLEAPSFFTEVECKRCGARFAVNMANVAYCSDTCRALTLQDLGIKWDKTKPAEERWGNNVPLVVPPAALEVTRSILEQPTQSAVPA